MMLARGLGLAACFLVVGGGAAPSAAQACSGAGIFFSTFAVGGLAVFDIATAPASVRRYNEGVAVVAPWVNPRDRTYGVSVSLPFGRSRPGPSPIAYRPPLRQDSVRPHKSPGMGLALSLVSTAVPMAAGAGVSGTAGGATLFLTGIVVGPSVGHFYAGRGWRGVGTAALRAAGMGLFIASFAGCFDD
jgi:hypothetical protein